ncbi:MAG: type I restriction enzyme HsdR N-terminal domain-containing protein [Candidatus Hodarchaeota archaeon]
MEKELKKKLKTYSEIFNVAQEEGKKEADVVMYVVEFFKDALCYDVFKEISKEYQVKEKYCDVAIKIRGQVELIVEVKQPGIRLADRHIDQAENYAMKSGTKWVLLTNGVEWKLFHVSFTEEEGIERSTVFRTDFSKSFQQKPDEVIEKFKLLHKKNFIKGELEKYWKKKTLLIPLSLSKALFTESVLNALKREVNRGAEVRAGIEDIAQALKNMFDKEVLADIADLKIKKRKKKIKPSRKMPIKFDYTGKTPVKIQVLKNNYEVKTWRDVLINTAEYLIAKNPSEFRKLADKDVMRGGKRLYLSKDENLIYAPRRLSNGLYVDVNLSANFIMKLIEKMLKGCGYKESDIKIHFKD